jgi:hypothetical protein
MEPGGKSLGGSRCAAGPPNAFRGEPPASDWYSRHLRSQQTLRRPAYSRRGQSHAARKKGPSRSTPAFAGLMTVPWVFGREGLTSRAAPPSLGPTRDRTPPLEPATGNWSRHAAGPHNPGRPARARCRLRQAGPKIRAPLLPLPLVVIFPRSRFPDHVPALRLFRQAYSSLNRPRGSPSSAEEVNAASHVLTSAADLGRLKR